MPGQYDLEHPCHFHEALFRDVYPCAGRIRTVDISKGGSYFCPAQHIHTFATDTPFRLIREIATCKVQTGRRH